MRDRGRSYVDPEQKNSREFGTNELPSKDAHIAAIEAELATLRERVEELERERDRWYSVAENAEAEAERNKELREEHARRRVHTEASWYEAVLDRDSWRSRAEAAEASLASERAAHAETRRALDGVIEACNHTEAQALGLAVDLKTTEAALAETRKVLEALDRMNRGVDWCDQDEQARRWSAACRVIEGGANHG